MQDITSIIQKTVKSALGADIAVELVRTEEKFGDYTTNVALHLAGKLKRQPREVAEQLAAKLSPALDGIAEKIEVAGPGFINLTLTTRRLLEDARSAVVILPNNYQDKSVVVEYSDPNPFKVLHAGHFYTSVVGDAIANLFELSGATVHRVNFGGDVGRHVGQTMWSIIQEFGGEFPDKLDSIVASERPDWLAAHYINGTNHFEEAKNEIVKLNEWVYKLVEEEDYASPLARIYWQCRQWSYDYFDEFYKKIGSKFEKYYPESTVASLGLNTVKKYTGQVFTVSDGAVVFEGEKYGLHTRVFVNSQGLPTYEAKDVGLIMRKWQDYHFDKSVVITGNEQEQYMAVVLEAIKHFAPDLANRTSHITHGMVKMKGGVKMSSRLGNILRAEMVLQAAKDANKKATGHDSTESALAAVKYAFLKQRTGGDIIYDPDESVSLEGNSGPYLQYAHARARSVIAKSGQTPSEVDDTLQPDERSLARKIGAYPEVLQKTVDELVPHVLCTYLHELTQNYNRFYEKNKIVGDEREAIRLHLTHLFAEVIKDGLGLLSINAPDKM